MGRPQLRHQPQQRKRKMSKTSKKVLKAIEKKLSDKKNVSPVSNIIRAKQKRNAELQRLMEEGFN